MILGDNMENNSHRFLWLKILIVFFLIILSTIVYARYKGTTTLKVKEYNVTNKNIPSSFYGYKIIQLSDIHYNVTTTKKELTTIVKKTNKSKPDIVIISGDLLDKNIIYTESDSKDLTNLLNNINSQYKYIITGDHDNTQEIFKEIIDKTDFKLLDNTYEVIYNNDYESILIGGISTKNKKLSTHEKIASIDKAIGTNNTKYNILILHEPSLVEELNYKNYQLVLAGHTHKGQINIPGIRQLMIPKKDNQYLDTYYKLNDTDLYISSGIGTTNIKARLFNTPSMNLYRLLNK